MKATLKKYPFFVALLPLFFVLHGYAAHAGFIAFGSIVPLFLTLLVGCGITYLIFRMLLKQAPKGALMTLYCMGFYLFFGALFDFLKAYSPWRFVYKYSVLLGLFAIFGTALFILLRKSKKDLSRTIYFFNLLFLILIVVDLFSLGSRAVVQEKPAASSARTNIIPDNIAKPNIYLLLFDEYSATHTLQSLFGFDNSALDSFLVKQGFHLLPQSRSNYPETSFSMASCLDMDYLSWLHPDMAIKREHYQHCADQIRNNKVVGFLAANGYQINNQSVFDLQHHPAPVSQRWLSIDTRLITEETLLDRVCHEFNGFIGQYALLRKILPVTSYAEQMQNNDRCLAGVLEVSKQRSEQPRFVYGHFLLPHFPYYKDKNGNLLPDSIVNTVMQDKLDPHPKYLEYVQYTNTEVRKLISNIRSNDPGAAIIFMSDHGYRWNIPPDRFSEIFYNQNAVYLPMRNYEKFYDSITNVNQFRVIFNTMFRQQYPLLKDTSMMVHTGPGPH